jgi:hypothetical protein
MNSLINYSEYNSYRETYLSPNNKEKSDTIQLNIESDKIFLIHNWKELNKSSRVILYANDVVPIGNTEPKWQGYINSSFTYRGWGADVSFRYQFGGQVMRVFLCSELLYSQNKSLYLEIRIREC